MARRTIQSFADEFLLLGGETRFNILMLLSDGASNISELAEAVGTTPAALGNQLALLRRAGVVTARRSGRTSHYEVAEKYGRFVEAVISLQGRQVGSRTG